MYIHVMIPMCQNYFSSTHLKNYTCDLYYNPNIEELKNCNTFARNLHYVMSHGNL